MPRATASTAQQSVAQSRVPAIHFIHAPTSTATRLPADRIDRL